MERRLNCYNYIFSSCQQGSRCNYGHVIVKDKDEYLKNYEMNLQGTRDKTSPRGNWHIDAWLCKDLNDSGDNFYKKTKFHDDNSLSFQNCNRCYTVKCLTNSFRNKNVPFICRDCISQGHSNNIFNRDDEDGVGVFDKLGPYHM